MVSKKILYLKEFLIFLIVIFVREIFIILEYYDIFCFLVIFIMF